MNIKKFLSFIIPIKIHQKKSEINTSLEIAWNNGQLVLDSKNTNFSYGSLQKVLKFGLLKIGFEKVKACKHIAVLGVAGGSVIKSLIDEVGYKGKITGVELDKVAIDLANRYFGLDQIENLEIIIGDAQSFVQQTTQKFDLVIIDIFQDNVMPGFLFDEKFTANILDCLTETGTVLFNTIVSTNSDQIRNANYLQLLEDKCKTIRKFSNIEGDNELFVWEK
ncbi:spermidine synthase [Flavobacterium humi]|uniref:Methyltransferase domain-containing protein n=1 Tax=Flavobacterium humi TaxID=2562683 RepID=A0A4Z0LCI5_9FLAO|nr:fused MFS/spermidine synthase [Flavobacterium humi]TGD59606.1 methyltransferase domain-containing protein [Flavobacterium humi]